MIRGVAVRTCALRHVFSLDRRNTRWVSRLRDGSEAECWNSGSPPQEACCRTRDRLRNGRSPLSACSLLLEHWQSDRQERRLPELLNLCRGSSSARGAPSWIYLSYDR